MTLWENDIPDAIASEHYKEEYRRNSEGRITGVSKVSTPTLSVFFPAKSGSYWDSGHYFSRRWLQPSNY